jgi:hypothetical protein
VGNTNVLLTGNNCQNIMGLMVSLHVTQDITAATSGGGDIPPGQIVANGGFSLQLNATPYQMGSIPAVNWMQYLIVVKNSQIYAFVQYFDPAGVKNPPNAPNTVFLNLPSNTISAGYVLAIDLFVDGSGNVTAALFSVTDNAGNMTTEVMPSSSMPMPTLNNNTTMFEPFPVFSVDVVGPSTNEMATFFSGSGYITYQTFGGQVSQQGPTSCPISSGPIENSIASYGTISPSTGATVTQPLITPNSGALATSMDPANNLVRVYHFYEVGQLSGVGPAQYSLLEVGPLFQNATASPAPTGTLGSPIVSYQNTIYNAPEVFYLTTAAQGQQQIEQLWSANFSPNSLTSLANAQPSAMGSGLAGYIDPVSGSDNVFYQGTDQQVHVLTWTPAGG